MSQKNVSIEVQSLQAWLDSLDHVPLDIGMETLQ